MICSPHSAESVTVTWMCSVSGEVQLGELSTITMKCCTLSLAINMIMILLKNIITSHSFNSGNLNSQRKQEAL